MYSLCKGSRKVELLCSYGFNLWIGNLWIQTDRNQIASPVSRITANYSFFLLSLINVIKDNNLTVLLH